MKHRKGKANKGRRGNNSPGYLKRVMGVDVAAGEVTQVVIAHDSGCPMLRGGACACTPDVSVRRGDSLMLDVGADGRQGDPVKPS